MVMVNSDIGLLQYWSVLLETFTSAVTCV